MRTYVCTFGYDSRRVTRPVLSNGLDEGDRVVLLRPDNTNTEGDENQRAETAFTEVEQMIGNVEPRIQLDTVELSPTDFDAATRQSLETLASAEGDVIAVFGGGAREIYLPFAVATMVHRDGLASVLQFGDTDHEVRSPSLPDLLTPIPDAARSTLSLLADHDGHATLPELAEASEHAKSSVGRHLDALESAGAVGTSTDGQTRVVELTLGGELRLHHGSLRGSS